MFRGVYPERSRRVQPETLKPLFGQALKATNITPSHSIGLDTCLRRYHTTQTVIPVKTGIQAGEARTIGVSNVGPLNLPELTARRTGTWPPQPGYHPLSRRSYQ